MRACSFQPGNFTRWGSEGVNGLKTVLCLDDRYDRRLWMTASAVLLSCQSYDEGCCAVSSCVDEQILLLPSPPKYLKNSSDWDFKDLDFFFRVYI